MGTGITWSGTFCLPTVLAANGDAELDAFYLLLMPKVITDTSMKAQQARASPSTSNLSIVSTESGSNALLDYLAPYKALI